MQNIDEALRGQTGLPVRFVGVQELLTPSQFSPLMFQDTTMTWIRETPGQEPTESWSVPVPERPSQAVYYRDAIVLDHNNEFVAVQNLTSEPISSSQANLDKFVATIVAAAATEDTDTDGLPDHWERDHFGDLAAGPDTRLPGGRPALLAFATGGHPAPFTIDDAAGRPFRFTLRNRVGQAATHVGYQIQTSADGGATWSDFQPAHWSVVGGTNAYDGTATRLNTYTYTPSATPGPDLLFRLVTRINP